MANLGERVRDAVLDAMMKVRIFSETWEGFEENTPEDAEELLGSMLMAVENVLRENDESGKDNPITP